MKRPSATPGICRIDQPSHRTHGFFMRLQRQGKIHSAFFTDKMCGGRALALAAAQVYRRTLAAKLGTPVRMSRRDWAETRRRKGSTGIIGVRRVIIVGQSGRRLKFWVAAWSPELGVVRKKQFSIRKFGEQRARQLAIRARRAGVRGMKP